MTARFASISNAWRDSSGATRSWLAVGIGLTAFVGVGLALVIGTPDPSRAESSIAMRSSEVARLKNLDQGAQAELLIEGTSDTADHILSGRTASGKLINFTIPAGIVKAMVRTMSNGSSSSTTRGGLQGALRRLHRGAVQFC